MMLLMVLTGEEAFDEAMESRLELAREEADGERRNEVRRVAGEKRAVMDWKRVVCMLMVVSWDILARDLDWSKLDAVW